MRWSTLSVLVLGALFTNVAHGGITWLGDIEPADPTAWTSNTIGLIGATDVGSITVNGNSCLLSGMANVGYESNATGIVTLDGYGATWISFDEIDVGRNGDGTLNINGGGFVSGGGSGSVAYAPGSIGRVNVDGNGSTWINENALLVGNEGE